MNATLSEEERREALAALESLKLTMETWRIAAARPGSYQSAAPSFYDDRFPHVMSAIEKLSRVG